MDHSNLKTVIFAGEIVNANAQLQLLVLMWQSQSMERRQYESGYIPLISR
jgi:hypothetical protein